MTLLELNFQRRKVKKEAAELLDRAVLEARTLTLSEQITFDTLTARVQALDEQIAQRESLRKMVN